MRTRDQELERVRRRGEREINTSDGLSRAELSSSSSITSGPNPPLSTRPKGESVYSRIPTVSPSSKEICRRHEGASVSQERDVMSMEDSRTVTHGFIKRERLVELRLDRELPARSQTIG